MKKLSEELINKYLDNELTSEEISDVQHLLETDPEAINKIKAAKFVESTIANSEITRAPYGFTEKLMQSISASVSTVKQDSKFFKMIISIFSVLIVAVFATTLATVSWGNGDAPGFTDKIKEFVNGLSFDGLVSVLSNNNLLIIGGGIIILLGFSILLLFETHKNFKHKLNTYLH